MKKLAILSFVIIGAAFISCEKEMVKVEKENAVTQEVIQKVESLDMNAEGLIHTSYELPGGGTEDVFLVEGCIAIPPARLAEMENHGIESEQYRTTNLVSSPRTIRVLGYTGGSYALTTKMRVGLQWAINNYNAIPSMNLNFTLSFGTNTGPADIVVYKLPGAAGGVAGFPGGGNPYKWVRIFSGLAPYSYNVHEHVITHEIGHCVGLRHTDWRNRASCGSYNPESSGPYGAHHIPGTPWGYDSNSLMLACFNSGENGEFGTYDRIALQYLY